MQRLQNILQHNMLVKNMLSKIFSQFAKQKQWLIFCLLIGISCVMALLYYFDGVVTEDAVYVGVGSTEKFKDKFFFNSDAMYLPILFKDIFAKSGSLQDWFIPVAPYFAPDFFIFFFAYILGGNTYSQIALYMVLQIIAFAFATLFLVRQVISAHKSFIVTACIIAFFVWLAILYGVPFTYLFINLFHFGIVILSILNIALWLKYQQSNNIIYFLAIILNSIAGTFSDALFLPQAIAPLFATIILSSIFLKDNPIKKAIILSFSMVGFTLLGNYLLYLLPLKYYQHNGNIDFTQFGPRMDRIFTFFNNIFISQPIYAFILIIFTLIVIKQFYLILWKKIQFQQDKNNLILILYATLTIGGILAFSIIYSPVTIRYSLPLFIFPAIIVFLSISNFAKLANPRFHLCIFLAISLLSVGALIPGIKKNGLSADYYPEYIACIDEALGQTTLSNGMANYWDAKHIQAFSKLDLTIAQHLSYLSSYTLVTSRKYFRNTYDFAIINNAILGKHLLSKKKLIKLNGQPKQIKECGNRTLFIYGKDGLQTEAIVHVGDSDRWQACDLPSRIEDSCDEATGTRSASPGQAGHLTFGPYIKFPSGKYNFKIRYASADAPSSQAGKWDAVLAGVKARLSTGSLIGTNGNISTIDDEFTIDEEYNSKALEIRTFKQQPFQLTIYDLTITRIE